VTLSEKFIPVDSNAIKAVAWLGRRGATEGRIAIRFHSDRMRFYPATVQLWQRLMSAESIGRFYNAELKHRAANCSRESSQSTRHGGRRVNHDQSTTVEGATA
jgi:hypothetical protein